MRRPRPADRHTMNLTHMRAYRAEWPWLEFEGSAACIKWSFRDLHNLDAALALTPGRSVAVQAGGNLGLFPKRLAEEFTTVYTFEPDPGLLRMLRINAPEPNIISYLAAIGDSTKSVSTACKRRDRSGRAVHEGLTHVIGSGIIKQMRVDDMRLHACDIIYLDVEGYEMHALKGAEQTIAQFKPVIGVEINRNIEYYGTKPDDLRRWITSRGYKLSFTLNSDEVYVPC